MIRQEVRPVHYCDGCETRIDAWTSRCLECGKQYCRECEKDPARVAEFDLHTNTYRRALFCAPCWEALSPDHPLKRDILHAVDLRERHLEAVREYNRTYEAMSQESARLDEIFTARAQAFRDADR